MGDVEVRAPQFVAAGQALQSIDGALRSRLADARNTIAPEFDQLLRSRASTGLERRVLGAGQVTTTSSGVQLAVAGGGSLRGGLSVKAAQGPAEYGANRAKRKTFKRRGRRGGSHSVTRRTALQFRARKADGYVFGPAVKAIVPKLSEAWTEAFALTVSDAVGGR